MSTSTIYYTMKNNTTLKFHLRLEMKLLIVSLLLILVLSALGFAFVNYLRGAYYYTISLLISASIGLIPILQCCVSSMVANSDYCIIKSWNHLKGLVINWEDIDEIYFRHYMPLNNQRILIKYRDKKNKQKTIVVLCDESDYIEDIIPFLKDNTKIRKY